MKKSKAMQVYFSSGPGELTMIKNTNLDCHNCKFVRKVSGLCDAFPDGKPLEVIDGGKCKKKRKKE